MKHKSIGERMRIAKSLSSRRAAALDWAANWTAEVDGLIRDLERAAGPDATIGRPLGQMKAVLDKRLGALPGVIDALSDDDL